MSLRRTILRNMLKTKAGNNKISEAWKKYQRSRYGKVKALFFEKMGAGLIKSFQALLKVNKADAKG